MSLSVTTMGAGPSLVMLHGWGMNSSVWSGFAERLSANYQLTLIDLPGHGESEYSGEQKLSDWARACLSVAPERAVWLGWSLGAEITIQAALDQPERVLGLLGLTGTPKFVKDGDWQGMAETTLEQFISASRQNHVKTLERFLALQVRGSEEARDLLRQLKQRLQDKPSPQPVALEAGLDLLKTVDLRAELPRLRCPTGWVFGERDTLVSAQLATLLKSYLPAAGFEVISGAAHAPFLSHPQATYQALCRILEQFHAE